MDLLNEFKKIKVAVIHLSSNFDTAMHHLQVLTAQTPPNDQQISEANRFVDEINALRKKQQLGDFTDANDVRPKSGEEDHY